MNDFNFDGLTDAQLRRFAVRCARRVQHLMPDPRSLAALDVAERHAKGEATDKELAAAREAAWAAREAAWAAWAAAWTAAVTWAREAAWATAPASAWAAARAGAEWSAEARSAEVAAQREILAQIRTEDTP